jgi:hypothetical protein
MDQRMTPFAYYERGLVLKQMQMFHPAIEDFQKAASDFQYAGRAYVQMALCLKALGNDEEAVTAFRKALASPTLSPEEQRHILYHIGQTLESLGRYAESLEVYGGIRRDDPGFRDVSKRIKRLCVVGRGSVPRSQGVWPVWMDEMLMRGRRLKPHMLAFLDQTGQWLGRQAETAKGSRESERKSSAPADGVSRSSQPIAMPTRRNQPTGRDRTVNTRRHTRVPVRLRSQFSGNGRMVGGEGELRDLSPWGCRVTSAVAVPIGADLKCCIFPQGAGNPFVIDGATVRWVSREEFGLAFTNVHPGVQQQIAQLCSAQAA